MCSLRESRDGDCSCSLSTLGPTSGKQDIPSLITDHSLLKRLLFAKIPVGGESQKGQVSRPFCQLLHGHTLHLSSKPAAQTHPLPPALFTQCLRSTSSSASHLRVRNGCFLLIISPSKNVVRVGYSWQRTDKGEVTIVTYRHKPKRRQSSTHSAKSISKAELQAI